MNRDAIDQAMSLVHHARTGGYADAASQLNLLLQHVQLLIRADSVAGARKAAIAYSLETMYLMQQQEDWVALADVVEFELLELIARA